jgi:hypothetical protein
MICIGLEKLLLLILKVNHFIYHDLFTMKHEVFLSYFVYKSNIDIISLHIFSL